MEPSEIETYLRTAEADFVVALAAVRRIPTPHLALNLSDRQRLLILRAWSIRYKLPLTVILAILLAYYDRKFPSRRKSEQRMIGVSVSTLVGKVSQSLLEDWILAHYPNDEHVLIHRQKLREKLMHLTYARLPEDPTRYVEAYKAQIQRHRQLSGAACDPRSIYRRRPYRDNPFL